MIPGYIPKSKKYLYKQVIGMGWAWGGLGQLQGPQMDLVDLFS